MTTEAQDRIGRLIANRLDDGLDLSPSIQARLAFARNQALDARKNQTVEVGGATLAWAQAPVLRWLAAGALALAALASMPGYSTSASVPGYADLDYHVTADSADLQ